MILDLHQRIVRSFARAINGASRDEWDELFAEELATRRPFTGPTAVPIPVLRLTGVLPSQPLEWSIRHPHPHRKAPRPRGGSDE